jgi:hypothetical protein
VNPKLVALGVAGWDLTSEEIINLALRHKEKLKGLRLRDVHLKEGMWKDVLRTLKYSMERLRWVSLRRIGYVPQFDEIENGGAEVPDDQPWALSESESEDDDNDAAPGPSEPHRRENGHVIAPGLSNGLQSNGHLNSDDEFDSDESDDQHEDENNATEFPVLDSPTISAPAPFDDLTDDWLPYPTDELDDDGSAISNTKRKAWEQWVVSHHQANGHHWKLPPQEPPG